jgi:hypothetical protein
MRLLTLLCIVILLCSAGPAQCVSYFPDSATFPFPLAREGWSSVRMAMYVAEAGREISNPKRLIRNA